MKKFELLLEEVTKQSKHEKRLDKLSTLITKNKHKWPNNSLYKWVDEVDHIKNNHTIHMLA